MSVKIKSGYLLRQVADTYLVVAVGERVKQFNGVVKLNESGAFLWEKMKNGASVEQLVDALIAEYDVDKEVAKRDVNNIVKILKEAGLAE